MIDGKVHRSISANWAAMNRIATYPTTLPIRIAGNKWQEHPQD
jgi:hypothetical protein